MTNHFKISYLVEAFLFFICLTPNLYSSNYNLNYFLENRGQLTDFDQKQIKDVLYYAKSLDASYYFFIDKISLVIKDDIYQNIKNNSNNSMLASNLQGEDSTGVRIDMIFGNSAYPALDGSDEIPTRSNYYLGENIKVEDVKAFKKIIYKNIYGKCELVLFFENNNLKFKITKLNGKEQDNIIICL